MPPGLQPETYDPKMPKSKEAGCVYLLGRMSAEPLSVLTPLVQILAQQLGRWMHAVDKRAKA